MTLEILNFGGGTQSMAVLCAVAEGLLPAPDCMIFADTGFENPATLEYIKAHARPLAERVGVEFLVVGRWDCPTLKPHEMGGLIDSSTGVTKNWPLPPMTLNHGNGALGKITNKCTGKWKTEVIANALMRRFGRVHSRRNWICFSIDEVRRAAKRGFAETENRKYRFPLLDLRWTREKSIRFVEKFGLPTPPRSACFFCPHHNDGEWQKLKDEQPLVFQRAVQLEKEINAAAEKSSLRAESVAFHSSGVPLGEVKFNPQDKRTLFCDIGHCHT